MTWGRSGIRIPHRAPLKVLGIETSADDTGIALIEAAGDFRPDFHFEILANKTTSQTIHAEYGGIYPNLAKREHAKNLPLLLEKLSIYEIDKVEVIAVTVGPGLEPCLWEGIEFAKKLRAQWNVPIVPINHMEGHIFVSLVRHEDREKRRVKREKFAILYSLLSIHFPAVVLLISGGHTELVLMSDFGQYKYLGRTRDDAVGEAFDKVARMLGLSYPGGPHISRLAEEARKNKLPKDVAFPRPMLHDDSYDFSFAGLKTAVLRFVKEREPLSDEQKQKVAREFEDAVADVLVSKTLRAADEHGAETVILGGGVSANARIRRKFTFWLKESGRAMLACPPEYCGDNALMIALAGYFRAHKKEFADPENLTANGNLKLC